MLCDKTKQPEFTKEQIAECEKCKHLSGKKIWCGKFRVFIHEPERGKKKKYPSIITQAGSFSKAVVQQTVAGNPRRTEQEIAFCKSQCEPCGEFNKKSRRCFLCGCGMDRKWPWKTQHCKIGKW